MRFEDRQSLFEAAFARIEPKNEAERERLARMKERFHEMEVGMDREIANARDEIAAMKAEFEDTKPIVQERDRINQEGRDALLAACDEQVDLIEQIVRKTARER